MLLRVTLNALGPLLALAALGSGCVPDFSAFTVVEDGGRDAGEAVDAGAPGLDAGWDGSVDSGVDAGFIPNRIDRPCPSIWAELPEPPPAGCGGRSVTDLAMPFVATAVAIGRADDGDVVVAYSELDGPDSGRVGTVRFQEDDPGAGAAGPSIEPVSSIGDVVGTDLRIATDAAGVHHFALWYRSDVGHEVQLHSLRGELFDLPIPIATGVGRAGVVDIVLDTNGQRVVAWHDDATGRNDARRELPGGGFSRAVGLRSDGDPRLIGYGAMSLAADASGGVHAAYQWSITLAASSPSYSPATGEMWGTPRTLDNTAIENRTSGVGADLTMVGSTAVIAYLDWREGVGEVRIARVRGSTLMPEVTTHLMGVVVADQPGDHPIEIATDARGWLHLLVANANDEDVELLYYRQTEVGGELRWIVDEVATLRLPAEEIYIDMKIGPDRRPHIVYWDPVRAAVRYATLRP